MSLWLSSFWLLFYQRVLLGRSCQARHSEFTFVRYVEVVYRIPKIEFSLSNHCSSLHYDLAWARRLLH